MAGKIPPDCMQLEQLSTQIQALYRDELGHVPSNVSCRLSGTMLTIVIENPTTPPERILLEGHKKELAEQVGWNLYKAIEPQIKILIEDTFMLPVVDMIGSSSVESYHTSIMVILDTADTAMSTQSKQSDTNDE